MWTAEHIEKTVNWYLERYVLHNLLSEKSFIKWRFRKIVGYKLNLHKPKTFCEKIQWLKFNLIREDFSAMVDKARAKDYVKGIIGEKYIIPTIGIWDSVDAVNWNELPNEFVIKLTSDSGGIVICKDKQSLDINSAKAKLSRKSRDYSKYNMEYPYHNQTARIIAEQLLVNGMDAELKDYKFYCFNGKAEYCQVIADRTKDETIDFFDREWNHQPFIGLNPNVHHAKEAIPEPLHYDEMLTVADKLAKAIAHPFVRIDLYNVNGKIYFGEITFFPSSGMGHIRPVEWDRKLGDMIKLPTD